MKSFAKLLIASLLLLSLSVTMKAQYVTRTAIDTTVNTDISYRVWFSTPDGVTGIEAYVAKYSGSGTGYAVSEGRIDSLTGWAAVSKDTLNVLAASTGTYTIIWPILPQSSNGYRIKYVTTGTQSSSVKGAYLRRKQF